MTRPITQQIPNEATTFEIQMKNKKHIYKIPEDLIWVDRKLVRIFYTDEYNFEPSKIQFFDERGKIIFEDRTWF